MCEIVLAAHEKTADAVAVDTDRAVVRAVSGARRHIGQQWQSRVLRVDGLANGGEHVFAQW